MDENAACCTLFDLRLHEVCTTLRRGMGTIGDPGKSYFLGNFLTLVAILRFLDF
jgi:hypothetical protein